MTKDAVFVKQLKVGSLDAFNHLFEYYAPQVYAFGIKYLKSRTDAEELVQDVFLKIWRNRAKLQEDKNFKSYLFTIAYNQIREYFQYKGVFFELKEQWHSGGVDNSTEAEITYRSVLNHIMSLLDRLPEKKQRIFRLSRFDGKSAKEIALLVGVSPKTVDNQVSEVIGFLRKHLSDSSLLSLLLFCLFL